MRLLTPAAGAVLVGPGPGEVDELLPWDGQELAQILEGRPTDGPIARTLAGSDLVIAYTRNESVVRALRDRARRLIAHDPSPPPSGPHASLWLAEPAGGCDVEPPDLCFDASERAEAERLASCLPPAFLAVHPGSGSPCKNWPAERFRAFAEAYARGARWLLVLGPAEDASVWDSIHGAVISRELPLRVLGALLARAGLFLGNDSGVSHLAAACGTPTLALFGPTDPSLWSPVGRLVRCLRHRDGLAGLAVEDVLREAERVRIEVGSRSATSAASGPPSG